MGKRLFLLDHCCVHRYFGHYAPSLELFADYFKPHFDEILTLVPASFDDDPDCFDPVLICPYPSIAFTSPKNPKARRRGFGDRFQTSLAKRAAKIGGKAGAKRRMLRNAQSIDKKYSFKADDLLFFPNAELFGIEAFCTFFAQKPQDSRPRVHFRLIGVNDEEAPEGETPFQFIGRHITRAREMGLDVQVSGETPKYVANLRQVVPDAFLVPYPFNAWQNPATKSFNTVACLGQGREDKGYFRIADIVDRVAKTHPDAQWIIHSMRKSSQGFSPDYQDQLAKNANLRIEPGYLSNEELMALYDEASFSILPYDEETYQLRGSAVLQEALAHGQLCVAPAGTGISSALKYFGNGLVARTNEEFAVAIGSLLDMPQDERSQKVKQARQRYDEALANSIPKILNR